MTAPPKRSSSERTVSWDTKIPRSATQLHEALREIPEIRMTNKCECLAICGLPRSGTTWIHNSLIACERYSGIPADDLAILNSASVFATDENRLLHKLMFSIERVGDKKINFLARRSTELFIAIFKLRWRSKDVMLKSPYFCFFLDNLYNLGVFRKFIFMKRNLDAVSVSMMRHPHIKTLLRSDYSSFFDFSSPEKNLEVEYVPAEVLTYVMHNFDKMTEFERALFKCLCFSSSFVARAQKLPHTSIFIVNYDTFLDDDERRRALFDFVVLDESGRQSIESSYVRQLPIATLPPHSEMLRNEILEITHRLWRTLDLHAARSRSVRPSQAAD
jgi:hypothetical protein